MLRRAETWRLRLLVRQIQCGAAFRQVRPIRLFFIEVLQAVFRQKKCFRCGITYKVGTRKLLIGGLRDKMAGLAGNLLKLSYKNLTNATIYRYHVYNTLYRTIITLLMFFLRTVSRHITLHNLQHMLGNILILINTKCLKHRIVIIHKGHNHIYSSRIICQSLILLGRS